MTRVTGSVRWLAALIGLLVHVSGTGAALAHSFEPALLDLYERDAGVFDVHWRLPGPESGSLALGVAELEPQLPAHCMLVATTESSWRADCGTRGLRGAALSVRGIEVSRVDVIVRLTWLSGEMVTGAIHASAPEFVLPGGRDAGAGGDALHVFWGYLGLGTEHILFGIDHLLFVLGLMLLVQSGHALVKTISAFTVAHSVTLAAAILGLVHVPPAPVEALIAVSIVLLALELTRPADAPPTLTRRYPWVVAFIFGLLHGLGFAGALTEIGIPPDRIALALLSFNLGVEVGQLAFVVVMLAPVALARRLAERWPQTRLIPPYAIGALAMAWAFERVQRFWI